MTAVVGTLIIGTFVARLTRRAQERRADIQVREERARADYQLRLQLIDQMTETASALYMTAQNYWRKKDVEKVAPEELILHRTELDQQYRASRIDGEVLEFRLEAYFLSTEPKKLWHAVMDLLTVRYFHLIGLATDTLRRENAGEEHSGLSVDELKDQGLLLQTYREKLKAAAHAAISGSTGLWPVDPRPSGGAGGAGAPPGPSSNPSAAQRTLP